MSAFDVFVLKHDFHMPLQCILFGHWG